MLGLLPLIPLCIWIAHLPDGWSRLLPTMLGTPVACLLGAVIGAAARLLLERGFDRKFRSPDLPPPRYLRFFASAWVTCLILQFSLYFLAVAVTISVFS